MIVEFSSPLISDVTLFLVTAPGDGEALLDEGVGRGRIWSMKEIERFRAVEPAARPRIVAAKVQFDCRLNDVAKEGATSG